MPPTPVAPGTPPAPAAGAPLPAHEPKPHIGNLGRPRFSWLALFVSFAGLLLGALVAGGGTVLLSSRVGLSPERGLAVAGSLGVLVAMAAGFVAAALARKVAFWEGAISGLIFSVTVTLALSAELLQPFGAYRPVLADIAYLAQMFGNPAGGIGLAAVALWFASIVGGSLGFLLAGSGKLDFGFSYEAFVAQSHLRLRKKSATMLMTVISICGVTVGVLALTVVLSVMSGFELDLKSKIIGTNAHAVVLKYGTDFKEWPEVAETVRKVPGVTGATPFILNEVMVSSDQNIAGALIKGIDPKTVTSVTNLASSMKEGSLDWLLEPEKIKATPTRRLPLDRRSFVGESELDDKEKAAPPPEPKAEGKDEAKPKGGDEALSEDYVLGGGAGKEPAKDAEVLPGVVIGKELAHSLKVIVGDRVNVVSPLGGELGPTGPMPKSRPFKVAGIFFSGMYEYDAKFAYISIADAQKFFGLGDSVTGLELKTDDIDNTRQITRNVLNKLDGYPYRTKDWGEMNKNLFSALRLEKLVMAVILAFIVLVACFNILSTLIMMVLEKGREIAILKSMGATDTSVMKIFVLEGLIIGAIGTAVGLVLGFLACLFVERIGIRLDAEVYYIDKLPVKIDALQFAAVAFIAVLLSYLATIYPATRASRMAPVDGLRNE